MHEENIALISLVLDERLCFLLVGESHTVALLRAVSQKLGGFSLPRGAAKEVRIRGRAEPGGAEDLGPFCSASCRAVGETIYILKYGKLQKPS